jgi:hypothetical protein
MSDQYTPTGGQTIFPRINFLKTFGSRLEQRISNGRVAMFFQRLFGDATLDLDFARTKSIGDLVTFTRASSATYVGSDGLIKTSPVNLLTYSNLITSANWTFSKLSAPTSATTEIDSPVIGSSVFKLLETTDTDEHYFIKTSALPIASSTTITTSLYINTSLGRSKVRVYHFAQNNLTFIWDLVNNAEISLTGGTSATVESTPIGNDWYRLEWTDVTTANNNFKPSIMSVTDSNQFSFAGDTSKGFYITGYQVEEGTTATDYIPTTAVATGAPRFDHDPSTRASLGLLIEEERTNKARNSENLGEVNTWKPVDGATSSLSNITSPDGVSKMWLVDLPTQGTSSDGPRLYQDNLAFNNVVNTFSFYARSVSGTGTFPVGYYEGSDYIKSYVTLTEETQRYEISWSSSTANIVAFTRRGTTQDETLTQAYVWGCQLEEGPFPTSYIPTEGSAVTRAPDLATIEGTNFSSWYNQSEGTMFAEFKIDSRNDSPPYRGVYSDALATCRLDVLKARGGSPQEFRSISTGTNKQAAAFSSADGTITEYIGSVNTATLTSVGASTSSQLSIGRDSGFSQLNGHISRLAYFPTRKTDQELIDLTT